MSADGSNKLTDRHYWDEFWSESGLPIEARHSAENPLLNAQLDVIDRHFAPDESKTILEIGGAPGGYLAYFVKNFAYKAHAIDYSATGCDKLRKNFRLLGLNVEVYQADIFSENLAMPQFDVVYSLGFIEHFQDVRPIVAKHVEFLKPGGMLLIGVPHFLKVYQSILRPLAPDVMEGHNLDTLDLDRWDFIEREFGLQAIFKEYVGGIQPGIMSSILNAGAKRNTLMVRSVTLLLRVYARLVSVTDVIIPVKKWIQRVNGKKVSAYAIAVYRKPLLQ